jgi:hypothetical protein
MKFVSLKGKQKAFADDIYGYERNVKPCEFRPGRGDSGKHKTQMDRVVIGII